MSNNHTSARPTGLSPELACPTLGLVLERWVKKLSNENDFLHAELHVVKPEEVEIADGSDVTFYVDIRSEFPLHTGGMTVKAHRAKSQQPPSRTGETSEDVMRLALIEIQEEPLQEITRLVIETAPNVRHVNDALRCIREAVDSAAITDDNWEVSRIVESIMKTTQVTALNPHIRSIGDVRIINSVNASDDSGKDAGGNSAGVAISEDYVSIMNVIDEATDRHHVWARALRDVDVFGSARNFQLIVNSATLFNRQAVITIEPNMEEGIMETSMKIPMPSHPDGMGVVFAIAPYRRDDVSHVVQTMLHQFVRSARFTQNSTSQVMAAHLAHNLHRTLKIAASLHVANPAHLIGLIELVIAEHKRHHPNSIITTTTTDGEETTITVASHTGVGKLTIAPSRWNGKPSVKLSVLDDVEHLSQRMTYENLTEDCTDATIRKFLHELTSGQCPRLDYQGVS
jgi:hypothetical protein